MLTDWRSMDTAPKSTAIDLDTGGTLVTGIYLLGFVPELAGAGVHRQCGVIVIWWEPHREGRNAGGWCSDGGDVEPSHWTELAIAPEIDS